MAAPLTGKIRGMADWEAFLNLQATPNERINFYKACHIFYDSATTALRQACRDEHNKYHKFPLKAKCLDKDKPTDDCDFSALVEHLIGGSRTESEAGPGSYYEKLFKADFSPIGSNGSRATNISWQHRRIEQNIIREQVICVNKQICRLIQEEGTSDLTINRKITRRQLQVYYPTPKRAAVDELRNLRNKMVGHPRNGTHISDKILEDAYSTVCKCYEVLQVADDVKVELDAIMTEEVVSENVVERIKSYYKSLNSLWRQEEEQGSRVESLEQQVQQIKQRMLSVEQSAKKWVEHVENRLDELSEDVQQLKESRRQEIQPQVLAINSRTGSSQMELLMVTGGQSSVGQPSVAITTHVAACMSKPALPPPLPTSSFAPGPPDDSEIKKLAPKVAKRLEKHGRDIKFLAERLKLDDIMMADGLSFMDQVAKLLEIWTQKSSDNSRDQLEAILVKANMSTIPYDDIFKKSF